MPKRFNNLQAALRFLKTPGAPEGSEVPDAPAGTVLRKFQDYKAGKVDLDYPRASASLPGSLNLVKIKPFGYPAADTTSVIVEISNRSSGQFSTVGLSEAALGIAALAQSGETAIKLVGFKPAKAVARNVTGTTPQTKTSKLTGLPYKSKASASYTFPIGRTTSNPSFSEQKGAIIALIEATPSRSVSFVPEKF